jgi:surfactin synthase thioesterase subunit
VARHNEKPVFFTDFSACNDYQHGEVAAAAVTCPVLFLLGKKIDSLDPGNVVYRWVDNVSEMEI